MIAAATRVGSAPPFPSYHAQLHVVRSSMRADRRVSIGVFSRRGSRSTNIYSM